MHHTHSSPRPLRAPRRFALAYPIASVCCLLSLLLSGASPAAAGHWSISVAYNGSTTRSGGLDGFDPTPGPWGTAPNMSMQGVSLDGIGQTDISSAGTVVYTYTWQTDPGDAAAGMVAPTKVYVSESASGSWYGHSKTAVFPPDQPQGDHSFSGNVTLGGDGWTVTHHPYGDGEEGGDDATAYRSGWVTVSGGTFQRSCDLNVTASANDSMDWEGSCSVSCSYSCSIVATPYGMHYTAPVYVDNTNGILAFQYGWWSTTGNLSDISTTLVYEHVEYPGAPSSGYSTYQPPDPPFSYTLPNNPVDYRLFPAQAANGALWAWGDAGGFTDGHKHKTLTDGYDTFTGTQEYRFFTPGVHGFMSLGLYDVMDTYGAAHPIVRTVAPNPPFAQAHKYTVTKSGYTAEYVY